MNFSLRGLPTESIETILTLEMPCEPHSKHERFYNIYEVIDSSSIFKFSQGDGPDFPLSNFNKKIILILSSLGSI